MGNVPATLTTAETAALRSPPLLERCYCPELTRCGRDPTLMGFRSARKARQGGDA